MPLKVRTKRPDKVLKQVIEALREYASQHANAQIDVYRYSDVSIRVRVVDRDFSGRSRAEREDDLWAIIEKLPEEVVSEISLLLLLTPDEAKKSFANMEFDNPVPSRL